MSRRTAGVIAVKDGKITDEALGMIFRKARDGALRVERGLSLDTLLAGYQAANEGREFSTATSVVWRTVEIGTHRNIEALRKDLIVVGAKIGVWGDDILGKTKLSRKHQTLYLVAPTVRELGFPNGAPLRDIYDAGLRVGYKLCPAEVGPQLRLRYMDQPSGEVLRIAMNPIIDSDGKEIIFSVVQYDEEGFWLDGEFARLSAGFGGNERLVFVRPQVGS